VASRGDPFIFGANWSTFTKMCCEDYAISGHANRVLLLSVCKHGDCVKSVFAHDLIAITGEPLEPVLWNLAWLMINRSKRTCKFCTYLSRSINMQLQTWRPSESLTLCPTNVKWTKSVLKCYVHSLRIFRTIFGYFLGDKAAWAWSWPPTSN
jgi:hypothetical protein